ncbi:hypothetical protein AAVH_30216 [Aphelenchoides avenae]|nr:hypothetical protein AAVH_30216 [Aphelenchus avenae]
MKRANAPSTLETNDAAGEVKEERIEHLEGLVASTDKEIHQHNKSYETDLQRLKEKVDSLKDENAKLAADMESATNQLDASRKTEDQLRREVRRLEASLRAMELDFEIERKRVRQLEDEVSSKNKETEQREKVHAADLQRLNEEIDGLNDENAKLLDEKNSVWEQVGELQSTMEIKDADIERLISDLKSNDNKLNQCEKDYDASLRACKENVDRLNDANRELAADRDNAIEQCEKLRTSYEELQLSLESADEQVEKVQSMLKASIARIERLEGDVASANDEIHKLQKDKADIQDEWNEEVERLTAAKRLRQEFDENLQSELESVEEPKKQVHNPAVHDVEFGTKVGERSSECFCRN